MLTGFMTGAALIGLATALLTAAWSKIKVLLLKIWGMVFVTVEISGPINTAVKAYCWSTMKRSPIGAKRFLSDRMWVRPKRRVQAVAYEALSNDPIIFWKGWRPFVLGATNVRGGNGNADTVDDGKSSFTFIRGMFKIDPFLAAAMEHYNEMFGILDNKLKSGHRRFRIKKYVGSGGRRNESSSGVGGSSPQIPSGSNDGINISIATGEYRLIQWNVDEIGPDLSPGERALDALALPEDLLAMLEKAKHWLASAEWYRRKQIPWTFGVNFYGPPGTGKSSTIRGMGEDLDLPIFIFDLASMSNKEFMHYWNEMKGHTPCIAAVEDIDAVFNKRENVTGENGGGLTFDCYINATSGIEGCDGVLKVQTTNRIEMLDPALGVPVKDADGKTVSSRPMRADYVIELRTMDDAGRLKVANRILDECPELIPQVLKDGREDSGVQFTNRCKDIALQEYWRRKEGKDCTDFDMVKAGYAESDSGIKAIHNGFDDDMYKEAYAQFQRVSVPKEIN